MIIENKVNRALINKGMAQKDLAKKLGYHPDYLCRVIHGASTSRVAQYRIARALNMKISELWPKRNGVRKKALQRRGRSSR